MAVDLLRPHWRHKQCGGIVVEFGDEEYRCEKCVQTGRGLGAIIPSTTLNHRDYFRSHPELEVVLLSAEEVSIQQTNARAAGAQ